MHATRVLIKTRIFTANVWLINDFATQLFCIFLKANIFSKTERKKLQIFPVIHVRKFEKHFQVLNSVLISSRIISPGKFLLTANFYLFASKTQTNDQNVPVKRQTLDFSWMYQVQSAGRYFTEYSKLCKVSLERLTWTQVPLELVWSLSPTMRKRKSSLAGMQRFTRSTGRSGRFASQVSRLSLKHALSLPRVRIVEYSIYILFWSQSTEFSLTRYTPIYSKTSQSRSATLCYS